MNDMKRAICVICLALAVLTAGAKSPKAKPQLWPDGTVMDAWLANTQKVDVDQLGKKYVLTDYGVVAGSPQVQTQQIQAVIDRCAQEGGGVVVVPIMLWLLLHVLFDHLID